MNKFGEVLKDLRTERNLTRKALATILNVSERLIGYWENGNRECSFSMLLRLADFFEVTTDYLLGRTDY